MWSYSTAPGLLHSIAINANSYKKNSSKKIFNNMLKEEPEKHQKPIRKQKTKLEMIVV